MIRSQWCRATPANESVYSKDQKSRVWKEGGERGEGGASKFREGNSSLQSYWQLPSH